MRNARFWAYITMGPVKLTLCCAPESTVEDHDCDLQDVCPVRIPVRRVHSSLVRFLSQVTLAYIASDTVMIGLNITGSASPEG